MGVLLDIFFLIQKCSTFNKTGSIIEVNIQIFSLVNEERKLGVAYASN